MEVTVVFVIPPALRGMTKRTPYRRLPTNLSMPHYCTGLQNFIIGLSMTAAWQAILTPSSLSRGKQAEASNLQTDCIIAGPEFSVPLRTESKLKSHGILQTCKKFPVRKSIRWDCAPLLPHTGKSCFRSIPTKPGFAELHEMRQVMKCHSE